MAEETSIKKRLAAGQGILESVVGGLKARKQKAEEDVAKKAKATKEFFTTAEGFKKGIAKTVFSGDGLISSYMRGRLDPKKLDSDKKTTPTKLATEKISSMAKDVATIRQAVSALLDFEKESKEQSEREKQAAFLEQQDAKEAELEASRVQPTTPTPATATVQAPEESSGGGMMSGITNIFSNVFGFLKKGLLKAFRFIFKPSNLLKALGRVFIIGTIVISLFKGIMAGFDRWKETGSISEAIIAGLGAVVDFLSFGLLGEDTVRSVFDTVGGWIDKIKDTIVDTFYDVKDWIVNNVGIPEFTLPMWAVAPPIALINKGAELIGKEAPFPKEITIGPFYPFKDNKKSATPEYSERPIKEEPKTEELSSDVEVSAPQDMPKPEDLGSMAESKVQNLGMQAKEALPDVKQISPEKMSDMMTGKFGDKQMDMGNMLGPLVEKYGGTEATESMKKDQEGLSKFMNEGGIDKAMSEMGEKSSSVPQSIDQGISTLSEKIKSGGVETGPAMPNLGQQLGESSADVESGQRMESVPDMGNIFNAPSTTNNKGSTGKKKLPPADVFNSDFANVLMRT